VLRRVRDKYGGAVGERFGPTLAAEHLESEDGLKVHAETLRRWMLAEGFGVASGNGGGTFGGASAKSILERWWQMDGSFHAWLEAGTAGLLDRFGG